MQQLLDFGAGVLNWIVHIFFMGVCIAGGVGLVLTDTYLGGTFYDSIFTHIKGPGWLQAVAPWFMSMATSVAQLWMYQWIKAYKRENLPKTPIQFCALGGLALIMIWDFGADLGGVTQWIYGDKYLSSVWPTGEIEMRWIIGAGIGVLLALFAEPLLTYFVTSVKNIAKAMKA